MTFASFKLTSDKCRTHNYKLDTAEQDTDINEKRRKLLKVINDTNTHSEPDGINTDI